MKTSILLIVTLSLICNLIAITGFQQTVYAEKEIAEESIVDEDIKKLAKQMEKNEDVNDSPVQIEEENEEEDEESESDNLEEEEDEE